MCFIYSIVLEKYMTTYETIKSVKCIKHTTSSFREKPYFNVFEDILLLLPTLKDQCIEFSGI